MDYSSLPNDPDHPAGGDPWQSSPQPTRTNFPPPEAESEPSSPEAKRPSSTPEPDQQQYREESDHEPEPLSPPLPEEPFHPHPNGAARAPTRTATSSVPDIRFQGPPLTEEELRQQQMHQQRQQERYQQALHAQQHQRGPGPGRYHQGARAGQRPPQYKLQAKVTALERTGKKDPAIRFDVHVSTGAPMDCFWRLTSNGDEPSQVPDNTSKRHQAHSFRICEISRTFDLFES